MTKKRELIPIAGLAATGAFAIYMVVQLSGQTPTAATDHSGAATAEVHDAQGQVLLRGQFAASPDDDDDDVERKARLEPTGIVPNVSGDAEVEIEKAAAAQQEIEFTVRGLQPGTTVTFVIDGQPVGQASVDRRGRAELDIDVSLAAKNTAR